MPSSKLLAVALAALVLVSGCSMLPGGGGDAPAERDAPDYHALVLSGDASGNPYEATVTVTRDGDQVFEKSFESDGSGTFQNLTRFDEPGPYTVTVNTTLPDAGPGNESDRVTVNGTLGNQTVVDLGFQQIEFATLRLPREAMQAPLQFRKAMDVAVSAKVVVEHRGETVFSGTVTRNGTGPHELTDMPETGAYRVAVSGHNDEWTNDTVVLTDPGQQLVVSFGIRNEPIAVYGPNEPIPVT